MKDLESKLHEAEETLRAIRSRSHGQWTTEVSGAEMAVSKLRRSKRAHAFAHPDATLAQAIAYVKQAKARREVAIKLAGYGGATGYVKYKGGRNNFVLSADANRTYNNWGTGAEIAEDVKYFLEYGVLRPPVGERW